MAKTARQKKYMAAKLLFGSGIPGAIITSLLWGFAAKLRLAEGAQIAIYVFFAISLLLIMAATKICYDCKKNERPTIALTMNPIREYSIPIPSQSPKVDRTSLTPPAVYPTPIIGVGHLIIPTALSAQAIESRSSRGQSMFSPSVYSQLKAQIKTPSASPSLAARGLSVPLPASSENPPMLAAASSTSLPCVPDSESTPTCD
jgi:hypothetical protein